MSILLSAAIIGYAYYLVKKGSDPRERREDLLNQILMQKGFCNKDDEYGYVYRVVDKETYDEFYISIPIGKSIEELEKCLPAIETYFKNNATVELRDKEICIKLYKSDLEKFYGYHKYVPSDLKNGLNILLGVSREGVITYNLSIGSSHLSVIGATNSGKSVYVNCVLCNLIQNYSHQELELDLMDLKGNELNEYKELNHTVYHTTNVEDAINHFKELRVEMEHRYQLMGNCRDIASYNKANPHNKLKYRFIVIEECFSLMPYGGSYRILADIMSKARAAGMHFLLTSQRPCADVIPKIVATHIGLRVGLKTADSQESKNAIEIPGLERIQNRGAGIIKFAGEYTYFQGLFISEEEVIKITSEYRKSIVPTQNTSEVRVVEEPKKKKSKMFNLEEDL